jgi:hypothetical protein
MNDFTSPVNRVAKSVAKSSIDWSSILLDLWESGDEYVNSFATIKVQRTLSQRYWISDRKSAVTRAIRSHKKAIEYLKNLQAEHNASLRGES